MRRPAQLLAACSPPRPVSAAGRDGHPWPEGSRRPESAATPRGTVGIGATSRRLSMGARELRNAARLQRGTGNRPERATGDISVAPTPHGSICGPMGRQQRPLSASCRAMSVDRRRRAAGHQLQGGVDGSVCRRVTARQRIGDGSFAVRRLAAPSLGLGRLKEGMPQKEDAYPARIRIARRPAGARADSALPAAQMQKPPPAGRGFLA